jgi:hypothetical protein
MLQVSANELNAIKVIALNQKNLAGLGHFNGKEEMIAGLKKVKKVWWTQVKSRYGLPTTKGSRRLSIELDGDRAGQLLYKAKTEQDKTNPAGRAVQPRSQAQGDNNAQGNGQANNVQSEAAKAEVIRSVQALLDSAGIHANVVAKAGNGAAGSPQATRSF